MFLVFSLCFVYRSSATIKTIALLYIYYKISYKYYKFKYYIFDSFYDYYILNIIVIIYNLNRDIEVGRQVNCHIKK